MSTRKHNQKGPEETFVFQKIEIQRIKGERELLLHENMIHAIEVKRKGEWNVWMNAGYELLTSFQSGKSFS
jgi:ribosomal protein L19